MDQENPRAAGGDATGRAEAVPASTRTSRQARSRSFMEVPPCLFSSAKGGNGDTSKLKPGNKKRPSARPESERDENRDSKGVLRQAGVGRR
jgi:hypothetical protein